MRGLDSGDEAIHDLHLADVTCRFEEIENRELKDRIVQALGLHLGHRDLWDEGGGLRGLRVRGVEAVLILHVDHRLAAELFGDEKASGVGTVWRDDARGRRAHPQSVGRHAAEDDPVHFREVERDRREPGPVDGGDTVLCEELPTSRRSDWRPKRGVAKARLPAGRAQPRSSRDAGPGCLRRSRSQLVGVANGDNLFHERVDGRTAAVDDALSADLDHLRIGRTRKSAAASAAAWGLRSSAIAA